MFSPKSATPSLTRRENGHTVFFFSFSCRRCVYSSSNGPSLPSAGTRQPSIPALCVAATGTIRSGNRHYILRKLPHCSIPSASSEYTGTSYDLAGTRLCSPGTERGPLLQYFSAETKPTDEGYRCRYMLVSTLDIPGMVSNMCWPSIHTYPRVLVMLTPKRKFPCINISKSSYPIDPFFFFSFFVFVGIVSIWILVLHPQERLQQTSYRGSRPCFGTKVSLVFWRLFLAPETTTV